jgi:hypothetical protein
LPAAGFDGGARTSVWRRRQRTSRRSPSFCGRARRATPSPGADVVREGGASDPVIEPGRAASSPNVAGRRASAGY